MESYASLPCLQGDSLLGFGSNTLSPAWLEQLTVQTPDADELEAELALLGEESPPPRGHVPPPLPLPPFGPARPPAHPATDALHTPPRTVHKDSPVSPEEPRGHPFAQLQGPKPRPDSPLPQGDELLPAVTAVRVSFRAEDAVLRVLTGALARI